MSSVLGGAGSITWGSSLRERVRATAARSLPFVAAAGVALLVRAVALWCDRDSLLFETGGLDTHEYLAMASGLWSGTWPGASPFFWAPGYSLFLGLLSLVSSESTWFKLVQISLGTATCALTGRMTWLLFGDRRVAAVALGVAALYGPLVYYDLQISPATLDVFLVALVLTLLLESARRAKQLPWALCSGCVAGASAATRGGILVFVPLATWWLWQLPGTGRQKLLRSAAFALPVIVATGALAAHNHRYDALEVSHGPAQDAQPSYGPVLISYNLGINFLLGNHAEFHATNDVEHPLCFVKYRMAILEPERHGLLSASAQSRFLVQKAIEEIHRDPIGWTRLMGKKLLQLLHGEEISRDSSVYAARLENPVLAALLWKHGIAFPTGVLIPLALLGLCMNQVRSREHQLVLALMCTQVFFVLGFFVTTRYRLAICVLAVPYAAHALMHLCTLEEAGLWRQYARLACALGALGLCNLGLSDLPDKHAAFEYHHLGHVLAKRGQSVAAVSSWNTALALDPQYAAVHFELADYYQSRHDLESAAVHFVSGLRIVPTAYPAREAYAEVLLRQGKIRAGLIQLDQALAATPGIRARERICQLGERLRTYASPACYERQ